MITKNLYFWGEMRYIQPKIFDLSIIQAAVSTRNSGVSTGCFASLNMGKSTSDDKECVARNRKLFFGDLGIDEEKTALSYQVHGTEILKAETPCREHGYDALMTDKRGLFLVVSIADCTPVLIHDPKKNVVAALHAGWRGTVNGILTKAIQKMETVYGCHAGDLKVFIGPCLDFDHFEVGEEVANQFPAQFTRKGEKEGKFYADMKSFLCHQSEASGVLSSRIEISQYCTFCENSLFFSHRRDRGNTGRMVAVIGMR